MNNEKFSRLKTHGVITTKSRTPEKTMPVKVDPVKNMKHSLVKILYYCKKSILHKIFI